MQCKNHIILICHICYSFLIHFLHLHSWCITTLPLLVAETCIYKIISSNFSDIGHSVTSLQIYKQVLYSFAEYFNLFDFPGGVVGFLTAQCREFDISGCQINNENYEPLCLPIIGAVKNFRFEVILWPDQYYET